MRWWMKDGPVLFWIVLGIGLLAACYAHVPPKPGEPNPADYPAVHDRKAPDGGPR